jgi:hypothetical protein
MKRLALLVLALAALAAPASSSASPEGPSSLPQLPGASVLNHLESRIPPADTFRSRFRLEARGGYDVEVTTSGTAIILIASKGKFRKRFVGTAYVVRGLAKPERMRARFGKFGELSMSFREARNKTWLGKPRNCRGSQRFLKRRGLFVGNLRFKDRDGDVSLKVHRAKGSVVTVARKCLRQREQQRSRLPIAEQSSHQTESAFLALGRKGVNFTGFLAVEGRKKTTFLAVHEETRGSMAVTQIAVVRNQGRAVRANETLTRARISPPAPFHGTGRYRAAPDGSTTWSGSLSVNFPGARRFPLVGPHYETLIEIPF